MSRAAPPMSATCTLVGVDHEDTKSFALVESEAELPSAEHSVVYEIKWDAAVVPAGTHLGQTEGRASAGWVLDKEPSGTWGVGDRRWDNAFYFDDADRQGHNPRTGLFYSFKDNIQQGRMRGGSWWFRLRIVDKTGKTVLTSNEARVNWGD